MQKDFMNRLANMLQKNLSIDSGSKLTAAAVGYQRLNEWFIEIIKRAIKL